MANKALVIENPELSLEQKVIALLVCTAHEKKHEIEQRVATMGLSSLQLNLLHVLSKAAPGPLTVSQLKSFMVDDSPNVSRTLNKLAGAGLITKERSPEDQRTVYVTITEAGEQAHRAGDAQLMGLTTGLSREDLKRLFELLSKL